MKRIYRRLPGRGISFLVRESLWEGPDHLLHVTSSGYTEDYKRLYFCDVQAMTVTRTDAYWIWIFVFGMPLLTLLFPLLFVKDAGGRVALAVFSGLFGFALLVHALRGPTCKFRVCTPAQDLTAGQVTRVGAARRLMARVGPKILQVQAQIQAPPSAPPSERAPPA
ncbi:MAG: hypothetical protein JO317_00120 [Verrucomicrobiae bacterium]|nr:hypothetical protein [Verrucomicrobiae bacterium]